MKKIKGILKLIRVKQWVKNMFVFAPIIFANKFLEFNLIKLTILAFISFCFISSSVYILNDISDREKDKLHPKKKNRPLASGLIKPMEATLYAIILLSLSILISLEVNLTVTIILLLYLGNNAFYTFIGKNYALFDVFQISTGFILRMLAGAFAIGVEPSKWILLCTLFLTLFLGFGKRRGELIDLKEDKDNHRKSLMRYNLNLLETFLTISLACSIVFYALYTVTGTTYEYMYISNFFTIYALFRYYILLLDNKENSNPSDLIISDIQIWLCAFLWGASVIFAIMV
jgi:4-hydroxybenzoate polyprenyltransferase and related prenyltransferases